MKDKNLKRLVITALMAAMTMVATMSIRVPSPTGGYIHPGDGIVILSGILLGPVYGSLAAGIGSMFADLFSGYASFAIATFIIKALAAMVSSLIYFYLNRVFSKINIKTTALIIAGTFAGVIVTFGYLIFEAYILGLGLPTAATGVIFNIMQNLFGILISIVLMPILFKVPTVKELLHLD